MLHEVDQVLLLPSNFNVLLKDRIHEGNNILLVGPPGSGKTIFCENIANEYLKNDLSFIYVTLDKIPEEVKKDFNKHGVDLCEEQIANSMLLIDGYTWLIGKSGEKYHIDSLSNLTELQFRIARAALDLPKPLLLVFDSISPLSLYNSESFVMKFLQLLFARMKDWRSLGIFVVQAGVHSEEFYNTLGYMVDGIFDMKTIEEDGNIGRYFRIRNISSVAHETRWMPFVIGEKRTIRLQDGGERR